MFTAAEWGLIEHFFKEPAEKTEALMPKTSGNTEGAQV